MKETHSYDTIQIEHDLAGLLSAKRYEHTLGVAYTAAALAMVHEADLEKAFAAGLLHDCTKYMSQEEHLSYCKQHDILLSDAESSIASLLHAKTGSHMAMEKYHIQDKEILNAIKFHTTGRPNMNLLEKIIFIADYIEPKRTQDQNLPQIRKTAFQNLNQTLVLILKNTLDYLRETSMEIDPMTEQTYHFYADNGETRNG